MIIGPNVAHQLEPTSEDVTLYFVDPETELGDALRERCADRISRLERRELTQIQLGLANLPRASQSGRWIVSVLMGVGYCEPSQRSDPLIARVIDALHGPATQLETAATLAASAKLSTSRFQHRFRAHTGMAVRPYLRWRRLLDAISAMLQGQPISAAAQGAGFADAAHLTRTLRRHFGITPRTLARLHAE